MHPTSEIAKNTALAAMIGSTFTLASFVKPIYATFLCIPETPHEVTEVSAPMWMPMTIMAGLCIIFGVLAWQIPLKFFVLPVVAGVSFVGYWHPGLAALLLIIAFVAGGIVSVAGRLKKATVSPPFVGGEEYAHEMGMTPMGILGGLFYMLNHSIFKSLLFLNSGAVVYGTRFRQLKKLGGLNRKMPITGGTSFIASMSIAGILAKLRISE